MSISEFDNDKRHSDTKEISALCQEALQKIGPGHFRVRVLLEMTIIELAKEAPAALQPDRQGELLAG